MSNTRKILVGAIAAAALAASGALVHAQPAGPGAALEDCHGAAGGPGAGRGGMGYGRGAGHGGPGMMGQGPGAGRGGMWSNPAAAVEASGHLKVELKITPDQIRRGSVHHRSAAGTPWPHCARKWFSRRLHDTTAPSDSRNAEFAKQRIADMDTMATAVKHLYAVSPERKPFARQLAHGPMGSGMAAEWAVEWAQWAAGTGWAAGAFRDDLRDR